VCVPLLPYLFVNIYILMYSRLRVCVRARVSLVLVQDPPRESIQVDDTSSQQFVSSVCWKRNGNVLIGANSQGIVKIFELV